MCGCMRCGDMNECGPLNLIMLKVLMLSIYIYMFAYEYFFYSNRPINTYPVINLPPGYTFADRLSPSD